MKTADLLRHPDRDTWRAFNAQWGWNTSRRDVVAPAVAVPAVLVDFHAVVRHVHINNLLPLSALEVKGGFVSIYIEEQGAFEWALRESDLEHEDPAVWGRYREPWGMQTPTLSLFLAQVRVVDATVQGMSERGFYAFDVSEAEVERVLAPMERLPWPSWPALLNGTFYAGDGAVAIVSGGHGGWYHVSAGARSDEALEPFRKLAVGEDWMWP